MGAWHFPVTVFRHDRHCGKLREAFAATDTSPTIWSEEEFATGVACTEFAYADDRTLSIIVLERRWNVIVC